jgi:hypothetical protein
MPTRGRNLQPDRWLYFMMRFELGLEKPDPKRAPISAATIAVAYLVGGLVPLLPICSRRAWGRRFVVRLPRRLSNC